MLLFAHRSKTHADEFGDCPERREPVRLMAGKPEGSSSGCAASSKCFGHQGTCRTEATSRDRGQQPEAKQPVTLRSGEDVATEPRGRQADNGPERFDAFLRHQIKADSQSSL